jgi:hypothetical protein
MQVGRLKAWLCFDVLCFDEMWMSCVVVDHKILAIGATKRLVGL